MAKSQKTKRKKSPKTVLTRFVSSLNGIALNHDWLSTT
jgi:hypothetical protein